MTINLFYLIKSAIKKEPVALKIVLCFHIFIVASVILVLLPNIIFINILTWLKFLYFQFSFYICVLFLFVLMCCNLFSLNSFLFQF